MENISETCLWRRITSELSTEIKTRGFKRGDTFLTLDEISSRYKVSKITSRRVLDELAGLGYIEKGRGKHPSIKGIPGESEILVLFSDEEYVASPNLSIIYMKIYEGILEEAAKRSCAVKPVTPQYFKAARDYSRAMVVIPQNIPPDPEVRTLLASSLLKVVCVHALKPMEGGLATIRGNLKKAAVLIMSHLADRGHRKIALAVERGGSPWIAPRFEAYYETIKERELDFNLAYVKECSFKDEASISAALDELMSLPEPPTAVFAVDDHIALEILRACLSKGIQVPAKLAVAGYDNIPESASSTPPLSTVDTHWKRQGSAAVEKLFSMEPGCVDDALIEPELIVRQSA